MKLALDGNWQMGKLNGSRMPARVPGSVYGNLLANGLMEDPFWRDNEKKALSFCEDDYEFTRTFAIEEAMLASDSVRLICEGLDTLAAVSINGVLIGTAQNMHRTYVYDIKDFLRAGENTISIIFQSPVAYARRMNMMHPFWGAGEAFPGFQHIRKGHYMYGWDWGPVLPDMGIWKSIYISFESIVRIEDVRFSQKHYANKVDLAAEVSVACLRPHDLKIRMRLISPGEEERMLECPVAGESAILRLTIENPELWWPNGYGSQPLYRVVLELIADNVTDHREYTLGLRTVRLLTSKDKWGREFAFMVNGVKIFAMGADYIPEDNILERCTLERTERLIKDCAAANFNMLRIWGGGLYASDDLLAMCDRYGLLVWHDFMFACALYGLTDDFKENVRLEAIDNIRRMRHHACLALWCGNNEIETVLTGWHIPNNEKQRLDYLELFEHLLPELVVRYDPETQYWPSSPSSFGGFDRPSDTNCGDTHYWDVWHGMKPFEDYKNHYFRFCSEFGFQSFPSMKTIESFTLPEDRNIFSEVMENHQKNKAANGKIIAYLAENYLFPRDLHQLVYASQILQAEAIKFGVTHMRRNRGRCMGATYWQVNDCWPVASWASIDYFGRWKALHYEAKRFFAPVLLSVHDDDGALIFNVSNERMTGFKGTIIWRLCRNDGHVLEEGRLSVEVPALAAGDVYTFSFNTKELTDDYRRETYLEFRLLEDDRVLSDGSHLFLKPKHFRFLDPKLAVNVAETADSFLIKLTAQAYARYVSLEIEDCDVVLSDNFFDLSPNEVKVVSVAKNAFKKPVTTGYLSSAIRLNSVYSIAHES